MSEFGKDRVWPFSEGSSATILVITAVWLLSIFLWFTWQNIGTGLFLLLASALWLLVLYFFRDPNRTVVDSPGQVIGPGDGEVVEIRTELEPRYLNEEVIRISLFLDVTDVHVQRTPLGGKVMLVDHQPGKYLQAFRPEASDVNEYIAMQVESPYGNVLVKQIAGILARRCVNSATPGDILTTGQRFGHIKFSSRVDLYLPPSAKLLVSIGDKVYGGLTPIAQLEPI